MLLKREDFWEEMFELNCLKIFLGKTGRRLYLVRSIPPSLSCAGADEDAIDFLRHLRGGMEEFV
ncbi:hypothetical protein TIFTF001_010278 [Ficus carica]|uniref:Uncharacterized protein n=1 Tax=Ficus carica TaxID=3494 RepID=A0AA87ZPV7_FICCA|nr:hypothetical protein TIFTF001_010278 [Ficus carica]